MTDISKKYTDAVTRDDGSPLPGSDDIPDKVMEDNSDIKQERYDKDNLKMTQEQMKTAEKKMHRDRNAPFIKERALDRHDKTKAVKTMHRISSDVIHFDDGSGNAIYLPAEAKVNYGCLHCEWKKTPLCPFKFEKRKDCHVNSICSQRKNYLLSMSRGYRKMPTYAQWHKDYLINKAGYIETRDYYILDRLQHKVTMLQDKIDGATELTSPDVVKDWKGKLRDAEKDLARKRAQWHNLWKDLVKAEDVQVERDTPKKVETRTLTMTGTELHDLMRGEDDEKM